LVHAFQLRIKKGEVKPVLWVQAQTSPMP
jgi:hypothetical protein